MLWITKWLHINLYKLSPIARVFNKTMISIDNNLKWPSTKGKSFQIFPLQSSKTVLYLFVNENCERKYNKLKIFLFKVFQRIKVTNTRSNETVILSADEKYRFQCNWHSNGLSRWKIEAGVTMISRWWRAIEII